MALSSNGIFELNASATASNVNGGYFNPANTNMATDLTTDANTANTTSPIVSSASYNFVAGDVGAWLYIKAGTNWTPGWYKILNANDGTSGANKALVNGTIGQAILSDSTKGYPSPRFVTNTVAGLATVGTPTSGTWTIDYSQSTAANNGTTNDLASTVGTTNPAVVTSVSYTFGVNTVGNGIHVTAGTNWTADWYEVVSVSAGAATLDKACGSSASLSSGTWRIGGAMSLNSTLDDALFEKGVATNGTGAMRFFIKNGSFTLGQAVSIAASGGTVAHIVVEGYNSLRGDAPTGSTRPVINAGANAFTGGANWDHYYLVFVGSAASLFTNGAGSGLTWCKLTNVSTTAARNAINFLNSNGIVQFSEGISYRGRGIFTQGSQDDIIYSYFHDSDVGIRESSGTDSRYIGNIVHSNVSFAIQMATGTSSLHLMLGNTLYGAENKLGTGLSLATNTQMWYYLNNIFYGFVTGITATDVQTSNFADYNDYFNNTTNYTNAATGMHDLALNPSFTSVSQLVGTGATSATNVLTYSTGGFNAAVTDGLTHVYISAGSGTGFGVGIYPVSAHTDTTLTLADPAGTAMNITSSGNGTAIAFQLTYGLNFAIGTNLKAQGYPGVFPAALTTSYTDIGAVQRQESSIGGKSLIIQAFGSF